MQKIAVFFLSLLAVFNLGLKTPTPTPTQTPFPTEEPTSSPTPIKEITNINNKISNLIDCIGPDGKQFQTTQKQCDDLNRGWGKEPNYLVDCNIHVNCGGGTRRIPKTQCDNFTCCTFNNGTSSFISKDDCSKSTYSTGGSYNYQYPTFAPLPTWVPIPTYASPTYSYTAPAGKSQADIDKCKNEVRDKYSNLISGCYIRFGDSSASDVCARAYQGLSGTESKNCEN